MGKSFALQVIVRQALEYAARSWSMNVGQPCTIIVHIFRTQRIHQHIQPRDLVHTLYRL